MSSENFLAQAGGFNPAPDGAGGDGPRVNLLWRPHGTVEDFVDAVLDGLLTRAALAVNVVFCVVPDVGLRVCARLVEKSSRGSSGEV